MEHKGRTGLSAFGKQPPHPTCDCCLVTLTRQDFFPSLLHSPHKWNLRDLASLCHLCIVSPLISLPFNTRRIKWLTASSSSQSWPSSSSPRHLFILYFILYLTSCTGRVLFLDLRALPPSGRERHCSRVFQGWVAKSHRFARGHPVLLLPFTHLVATSGPLRAISVCAPLPSSCINLFLSSSLSPYVPLYFSGTVIRNEVKVTLNGSTSNTVVTVDCPMLRAALPSSELQRAHSLRT